MCTCCTLYSPITERRRERETEGNRGKQRERFPECVYAQKAHIRTSRFSYESYSTCACSYDASDIE